MLSKKDKGSCLDILGIDREGILTLVELKLAIDPYQFIQPLKYYYLILEQGIEINILTHEACDRTISTYEVEMVKMNLCEKTY